MGLLRLVLEIDGDVYPELHAHLCALRRPAAREERLRQLAQAGLVWETVRLSGLPDLPPMGRSPAKAAPSGPPPGLLPVLLDVVDTTPPLPEPPAPPRMEQPSTDHADPPAHEIVMHRAPPRSRLLRMKERGLFKNG